MFMNHFEHVLFLRVKVQSVPSLGPNYMARKHRWDQQLHHSAPPNGVSDKSQESAEIMLSKNT